MQDQYAPFATEFARTRRTMHWPELNLLWPLLQPHCALLDAGCGSGRLAGQIDGDVVYTGFDLSDNLLEQARLAHPKKHFVQGDFVAAWPFADGAFDVVAAVASYHHITTRAGQRHFMAEALRVLRPGGQLFVTTWQIPKKHRMPNLRAGRFRNWVVPFQGHPRVYRRVGRLGLRWRAWLAGFRGICTQSFKGRNNVLIAQKPL